VLDSIKILRINTDLVQRIYDAGCTSTDQYTYSKPFPTAQVTFMKNLKNSETVILYYWKNGAWGTKTHKLITKKVGLSYLWTIKQEGITVNKVTKLG
jgi:hypothetical protein